MSKQNIDKSKGVSRRDFIKTTGMGAMAVGLGSSVFKTGSAEATQAEAASRPAGGSVSAKPYNVMVILTDQEQYLPKRIRNRGRTASCPTAPSQIPACGTPAPGSSDLLTCALTIRYSPQ
jgi:anaerobic selenocysteine-containing dehydrogenase